MSFVDDTLRQDRPRSVRQVPLPRREAYHPSPADWRDHVIYFLLPDRFSDGQEHTRPLLDPTNLPASRPPGFRFDRWAAGGGGRYQGGTLAGAATKLDYLQALGVTTLWVGPVFKQRVGRDDYHGYAVQDFLDVDPRLGTRQDLVALVAAAHARDMRVLLDVVVNHSGNNWAYDGHPDGEPPYLPWPDFHPRGPWRDAREALTDQVVLPDDAVWPEEFHAEHCYSRAGAGSLACGDLRDPHAEFRRTDFFGDRDLNHDAPGLLGDLARCYKYWIALTDCDGFRLDALKHLDPAAARALCGSIKEFAANLGKADFFLVGEVAGSNADADYYLQALRSNLNATLDIGEIRPTLTDVAKGLRPAADYFRVLDGWGDDLGSHRNAGRRRVSILDDHDHVCGPKVRFSSDARPADHQVVAGVAIQLFTLGIPCLYYGTEQAFAGPEPHQRDQYLTGYGADDRYLREAMFGPEHPRRAGRDGVGAAPAHFDPALPGFGPFGTAGAHCFNPHSPAYVRIAALTQVRAAHPVLRFGRQYQRPTSNFGAPFSLPPAGELIAWSRILDDEEALCLVNPNGADPRGADVLVDATLNAPASSFVVLANSAQAAAIAAGRPYTGPHPVGQRLPVLTRDGSSYIEIRPLPPAEVLVLTNRP